MPELNVLHFNLTGARAEIALPSCEKYRIRVTAVDTYGNRSTPIVSDYMTVPSSFSRVMRYIFE